MHVCVYCASSNDLASVYTDMAEALGRRLAAAGYPLVYGGGQVGLMGVVARAVHTGGGTVIGVIPEALMQREGVAYGVADEMIVTQTMRERKGILYHRGDAFVALPGGFGTLEEFLEVLTLKQLGYHRKPIILVNTDGFYDGLEAFFDQLYRERFARPAVRGLYALARDPDEVMALLAAADAA